MFRFTRVRKLILGTLAAAAIGCIAPTAAMAGSYPGSCYYKTVIVWEYETRPVVDWVTRYDHCGEPYEVKVLRLVTVKVPVRKLVKVCH